MQEAYNFKNLYLRNSSRVFNEFEIKGEIDSSTNCKLICQICKCMANKLPCIPLCQIKDEDNLSEMIYYLFLESVSLVIVMASCINVC